MSVAAETARVVARSESMRALLALIGRLAEVRSSVLLEGESGSGKDLLAHLIHEGGPRRDFPLVKIHCPSIPDELLESELFGHEKGAFTDARFAKLGKIEMAQGGTVYLDQVQDLAPTLQAKLLRVVEERRFERLGGTRTIEVDVRFVAASNVSLRGAVAAGTFREDLYHRLGVVPLGLPPLRERLDDVLPLAAQALAKEDWEAIDAAFASNNDPVVGAPASKAFRELFRHLVAILPPPLGVGPEPTTPPRQ